MTAACNKRVPAAGCASIGGFNRTQALFGTSAACIATPPSDVAVAFVALDARLRVRGTDGERAFDVEELFRLPGYTPHLEHNLNPGDLILGIGVPAATHARRSCYLKVRDRASYEFALVSVAAGLDIDGPRVRSVRLAAGGVGTRPWRFREAEELVVGQLANSDTWHRAAEKCIEGAVPAGQNAFKVELLRRMVIRALTRVAGAE